MRDKTKQIKALETLEAKGYEIVIWEYDFIGIKSPQNKLYEIHTNGTVIQCNPKMVINNIEEI